MKTFRLFATLFVVALCVTFVASCSDDDDDDKDKDKELTSLIIGKWEFVNFYDDVVWEYKSNGTWEDKDDFYSDSGKYWIKSGILYMESKIEEETWNYPIKRLNSTELILDDGDDLEIRLSRIR